MKWFVVFMTLCTNACAAEIYTDHIYWRPTNGEEVALHFKGGVKEGDLQRILRAAKEAKADGKEVTAIWLDSWGGDGDTGILIADWVAKNDMEVFVDDNCLSACAFAALVALGKGRLTITKGAGIGVHQVVTTGTGVPDPAWTRMAANVLRKYGAPRTPLEDMCNAPPDQMVMFGPMTLTSFGAQLAEKPFTWSWW